MSPLFFLFPLALIFFRNNRIIIIYQYVTNITIVYSKISGQNVLVSITVKSEAALECQKVENELKYYKINIHSV